MVVDGTEEEDAPAAANLHFQDTWRGYYIQKVCDACTVPCRPTNGLANAGNVHSNSEACVIIGGKTWPKDRRWVASICVVSLLAAAAYAWEWSADGRLPGGGSRTGLVAGIAGGLIIAFELLLWPRKRVRSWRLGSAQSWLRAHIWLGLLAVPLVLMHARLLFIGGLLNWALVSLFFLVIASGIWGLVLQQFLPQALLERVPAETIFEQIGHVARQQCRDIEKLVDAMCEHDPATHATDTASRHGHPDDNVDDDDEYAVVTGFRSMTGIQGKVIETLALYTTAIPGTLPIRRSFFAEIRPYLLKGRASGTAISQPLVAARTFMALRAASPAAASILIDRLEAACDQRRQFDLQARLHHWLHGWLLVHVPLSVALGVLLAIHIPVALWYW